MLALSLGLLDEASGDQPKRCSSSHVCVVSTVSGVSQESRPRGRRTMGWTSRVPWARAGAPPLLRRDRPGRLTGGTSMRRCFPSQDTGK